LNIKTKYWGKMSNNKDSRFETMCVHSGITEYEYGPVVPPIYQTSTFKFDSAQHGAAIFSGEEEGYIYTRMGNPTIEAMENSIAELEEGYKGLGCSSGMAAIHTVFAALLKSGDHVICSKAVYGPTATLLNNVMSKFNVSTTFVNGSNLQNVIDAVKPETKIIYIETPGNPTLEITDILEVSKIAQSNNAYLIVDNTFMSPALQQPLKIGADIVVHSLTKFLNGHADVVGGVIVVKDEEMYKRIRKVLNQTGGVIDPFNAFLVHRGLKTLALRMEKHSRNAMEIAEYLDSHPQVKWVRFPGLTNHPQFKLGKIQHKDFGGMISFELHGGIGAGRIVMDSVKLCQLAVSLGGVESLIQHPASMTHSSMGKEAREAAGITDGLVRLSVGIEHADDIIKDIKQALAKLEDTKE
jgi:methionine-gamma-lyase